MFKIKFLLTLFCFFILNGCIVPSLHPLFLPEEGIGKPELVGNWIKNEQEKWIITSTNSDSNQPNISNYNLMIIQTRSDSTKTEIDTALFRAVIGKIGKREFINLIPQPRENSESKVEFFGSLVIPHYSFGTFDFKDGKVMIGMLNSKWLAEQIEKKRNLNINCEKIDDQTYIITSRTKELKAFAKKHVNVPAAFADSTVLTRVNN